MVGVLIVEYSLGALEGSCGPLHALLSDFVLGYCPSSLNIPLLTVELLDNFLSQ